MYEAGEATQLPIKLHSTVRGTLDNEDLNEDGDCCSLRWNLMIGMYLFASLNQWMWNHE